MAADLGDVATDADITTDTVLEPLALSVAAGETPISGRVWTSALNGYGPVEVNSSNGGKLAGDGRTMQLAGKTYSRGYGVHGKSELAFALGGDCDTFSADIGVDDEVGSLGSVAFQVYGDGKKLFDSGVMTGASATKSIKVNVAGRTRLKLVVTDGGDGGAHDHADWAMPTLSGCAESTETVTVVPTGDPAGTTYVKLTTEDRPFTVTGTQTVRYGVDTRWIYKTVTDSGRCDNEFFGGDPAKFVYKSCYLVVCLLYTSPSPRD